MKNRGTFDYSKRKRKGGRIDLEEGGEAKRVRVLIDILMDWPEGEEKSGGESLKITSPATNGRQRN